MKNRNIIVITNRKIDSDKVKETFPESTVMEPSVINVYKMIPDNDKVYTHIRPNFISKL